MVLIGRNKSYFYIIYIQEIYTKFECLIKLSNLIQLLLIRSLSGYKIYFRLNGWDIWARFNQIIKIKDVYIY